MLIIGSIKPKVLEKCHGIKETAPTNSDYCTLILQKFKGTRIKERVQ